MESPTTAYIAHGCKPQWKSAVANAMPAEESATPGGGFTKCVNGSVTPQKIKPIPMPALNIIATQQMVLNSGFSPSAPNLIRPNLLNASHSANKTKPVAEKMNSQPRFVTTALRIDDITDLKPAGRTSPHVRMAATIAAVTPNTTGSDAARRVTPVGPTTCDPLIRGDPSTVGGLAVLGGVASSDPTEPFVVVVTSTSLQRILDCLVSRAEMARTSRGLLRSTQHDS